MNKKLQVEFKPRKNFADILLEYDQYLGFHPNYSIHSLLDPRLVHVLSIDLASGNGGNVDYTVMNIFTILPMSLQEITSLKVFTDEYSFYKLVQVGMFRSREVQIPEFAQYTYHFVTELCNMENLKIVLENNYEGNYYRSIVTNLYGENNEIDEDYTFVAFPYNMKDDQSTATRIGLVQNDKVKDIGCKKMRDQISNNQLILTESITIQESMAFAKDPKKKSGYEAMVGNDDAIMSCCNVAHFRGTEDFYELCDIVSSFTSIEFQKAVAEKLGNTIDDSDSGDISDIFE